MAAALHRWKVMVASAAVLWCVTPAGAQEAYRCVSHGTVLYSQVPCPGARVIGPHTRPDTDKWKVPPQDRAVRARRARLSPEDRQECHVLDDQLREQQHALQVKGEAATIHDEMPLVDTKKKFRELGC